MEDTGVGLLSPHCHAVFCTPVTGRASSILITSPTGDSLHRLWSRPRLAVGGPPASSFECCIRDVFRVLHPLSSVASSFDCRWEHAPCLHWCVRTFPFAFAVLLDLCYILKPVAYLPFVDFFLPLVVWVTGSSASNKFGRDAEFECWL